MRSRRPRRTLVAHTNREPSEENLLSTPERQLLLRELADEIDARAGGARRVFRVAVDGVDGAGKTTFADELGRVLAGYGAPVIRASVDGFHRAERHRRGRSSPKGFWLDSYDYARLTEELLDPLSPCGSRRFRRAIYDVNAERTVHAPQEEAEAGAVLLFDGIFLHRDELVGYWDYSIFLQVGFEVALARCAQRGTGSPDPGDPLNRRYVGGQRLCLAACTPQGRADVVIDNTDLGAPVRDPRPSAFGVEPGGAGGGGVDVEGGTATRLFTHPQRVAASSSAFCGQPRGARGRCPPGTE